MYHRTLGSLCETCVMILVPQDYAYDPGEYEIYQTEEYPHSHSHSHDHNRESKSLFPSRPRYPSKLADDLANRANAESTPCDFGTNPASYTLISRISSHLYLTSRCIVCLRQRGQNFLSSNLCGSFRRFLLELYVRSRQSTHPRVMSILTSPRRAMFQTPRH